MNNEIFASSFASRFRQKRKSLGHSFIKAAVTIGVSVDTLRKLETKNQPPKHQILVKAIEEYITKGK